MLTRPAKILIQVLVVIVAGLLAMFVWFQFHTPITKIEKKTTTIIPIVPETVAPLSSGTYLLYQVDRVADYGPKDWANDDVRETVIYRHRIGSSDPDSVVAKIDSQDTDGSVIASTFGTDLLVHRYSNTGDAIVSLDGTAKKISENWGLIRSKNGRYEVEYKDLNDSPAKEKLAGHISFRDRVAKTEKILTLPIGDDTLTPVSPKPIALSDDGLTVSVAYVGGWEGPGKAMMWKLETTTNTSTELKSFSKLTDLDFSKHLYTYTMSADFSKIIVAQTGVAADQGSEGMGGPAPGGATDVYLIDTKTDTSQLIFQDKDFTLYPVAISPNGLEWQYSIGNDESLWIGPSAPGHIRENKDRFTQGRLLEWLDHGLVVDRHGNDIVYIDRTTHGVTVLGRNSGSYNDPDYQTVNYIGSIEIK